jgi:hypothetical protein
MTDTRQHRLGDVMLLYELRQSVGQDLDTQNNCSAFISIVLTRRNFSRCGIWLRDELITSEATRTASGVETWRWIEIFGASTDSLSVMTLTFRHTIFCYIAPVYSKPAATVF